MSDTNCIRKLTLFNCPLGTSIFWEEMHLFGSVTAREVDGTTTIRWDDGRETIVDVDDDDPDQFTVIEPGDLGDPLHVQ